MLADELASADGEVHPSEQRFRDELEHLLAETAGEESFRDRSQTPAGLVLEAPTKITPRLEDYDFFRAFEEDYVREPEHFAEQIRRDMNLLEKTISKLEEKRQAGKGRLGSAKSVDDLKGAGGFLDGYVNVLMPEPGRDYELLVLGDLHGCYACFKAALMQADFFHKLDLHHSDPVRNPAIKLVLLGDYIDRGKYSYEGVLRMAMHLFLTVPDDVFVLRGNHEYYIELNGRIFGGVKPAEAIQSLTGLASNQVFGAFKTLFEALPNSLLFDRLFFVHAGIPRQDTLVEKWKDLSSLNDPEIRFQMMWSDPSEAEAIPLTLQKAGARFPFGRQQFKGFMQRLGCNLMVRGHERVNEGVRVAFSDKDAVLLTLFSAGGRNNGDLPKESNYREVSPVALTIRHKAGVNRVSPFVIDWERYNKPENNAFFRPRS
jgi:hypothetical protein